MSELTLEERPGSSVASPSMTHHNGWDLGLGAPPSLAASQRSPSVYHRLRRQLPDTARQGPPGPTLLPQEICFTVLAPVLFKKLNITNIMEDPQNTTPLLSFPQKNEN